jgi:cytochrome c553
MSIVDASRRGTLLGSAFAPRVAAPTLDDQQIAAVAAYYQQVRSSNGVATTK